MTSRPRARGDVVALAAGIGLGAFVRARYVLSDAFPVHDGGLFYVMIRELRLSHYLLPSFTSYNQSGIPFVYPPLGLYSAAILADAVNGDVLHVLRILPLVASILTIPAFFLLARSMLPSRGAATVALLSFALLPETFMWAIMGGGVTRSPGFFFSVLAIHQAYLLYARCRRVHVASTTLFSSLTVLSHAETAWFTAVSCAALFVAYGRSRAGLINSLLVVGGVSVLTAPWWAAAVTRHGVAPFLAAGQIDPKAALSTALHFRFTGEPLFPVLAALGLLGILSCWMQGRPLLIGWLVVILAQGRGSPRYAMLPLALLIGIAVADVLGPRMGGPGAIRASLAPAEAANGGSWTLGAPRWVLVLPVAILAVAYSTWSALRVPPDVLGSLTADDRAAMRWVATNTSTEDRFIVMGSGLTWHYDRIPEWFPALTGRASVATVQGAEWLPGFAQRLAMRDRLQACAELTAACLETWSSGANVPFTHVYVPKDGVSRVLLHSLRGSPEYTVIYDGPGAKIFGRAVGR